MLSRLLAVPDRCAAAVSRRRDEWRAALFAVVCVVAAATVDRYVHKAETPSRDGTMTRTAFLRWRPQILELEAGADIYRAHNYPNPPIMAVVLSPLTKSPPISGGVRWLLLKIGLTVVMVAWAMRLCGGLPFPARMLAVVLAAHPLLGDLNHGNVNIFVTFLVLACLELFRRGWDVSAGLALGFAVACKVTPALFLPYFGWKAVHAYATHPESYRIRLIRTRRGWWFSHLSPLGRGRLRSNRVRGLFCWTSKAETPHPATALPTSPQRGEVGRHSLATVTDQSDSVSRVGSFWRAGGKLLLGAAVGLFLFLFAVPAAWLATRHDGGAAEKFQAGWDENLTLLESWFDGMVKPFLIDGKITSVRANQSIPGVVNRLLTHEPSEVDYDEEDGRMRPKEYHNLADIGPEGAKWVVRACQAGFVLLIVLLCRADATRNRTALAIAAECGLIVLGMLLFSERTWKHHGTGLILPVAAIIGLWALRPTSNGMKAFILATLSAVTALTLVPSLLGGRAQDMALTYGTHTAAYLLLTAGVAAVLTAERRATGRGGKN